MAKGHRLLDYRVFLRQFPQGQPHWGQCEFLFDPEAREYDWLVVYDDLAPQGQERFSTRVEQLSCPQQNTVLITAEPSSIKFYGADFLNQFGVIITSQESWAIPHQQTIRTQPSLRWFYGVSDNTLVSYDEMQINVPLDKSRDLSTVCSNKQQKNTCHHLRFAFTQRLRECYPEMDVFGRGVRPIKDKAESLDPYRYHIVIENHIGEHHWTEKLADAFLGATLPFYYGCPNVLNYFPQGSLIPIDIRDFDAAFRTIREAIESHQFERRLSTILEARRRVLDEYNLFSVLSREIERRHDPTVISQPSAKLWSRHSSRYRTVKHTFKFAIEQWRMKRVRRSHQRAA
ncbi:MAG: hypothetical protein KDA86_03295 [Planctomycetaceae bacterium]|nr:hypothetical protein [Planctomycetaceae bacterium]